MTPTVNAIENQKGGVGKTTTCANLGVGLAQEGKRVLMPVQAQYLSAKGLERLLQTVAKAAANQPEAED